MALRSKLTSKIVIITALATVLVIPLMLIQGVIHERLGFREVARRDIAKSWTGEQLLTGPLLAVPYQVRTVEKVWREDKKVSHERAKDRWKTFYIAPSSLLTKSRIDTQLRYRGIHGVPVYTTHLSVSGEFSSATLQAFADETSDIVKWGSPYISIGVSDSRGISNRPGLSWDGQEMGLSPGAKSTLFKQGMHAQVGEIDHASVRTFAFNYTLTLRGMEKLSFTPTGLSTEVRLTSDWPHPSFLGRYLPEERESNQSGFTAGWRVSSFATDMERSIRKANQGQQVNFAAQSFGVSLIDPVDVYLQSERSVKYGFLFVGLTFVAFFLFEVLKRLQIHPVQYTLVGLSLSFFYLLLIAFSEHIGFALAYWVGTLACSGLLAVYTGAVLKNARLGVALGATISVLYGMLYIIIRSEDHALLMGSVLLFGVLALVMTTTRHLDWYEVSNRMASLKHKVAAE